VITAGFGKVYSLLPNPIHVASSYHLMLLFIIGS
jgi:hypothetical protein